MINVGGFGRHLHPASHLRQGPSNAAAIELWPTAGVELCPKCRKWEFFVMKEVHGHTATLRSGRDHKIDRQLT